MKRFRDVLIGVIVGGLLMSGVVFAANQTIQVNFMDLKYFFDGVQKSPPKEQQGFVYKGTTYVPLRFVGESLGKQVGWDGKTQSIYIGKQKEGTETYLEKVKPISSSTSTYWKIIDTFTSNTGERYLNGYHNNAYSEAKFHNEYYTNGKYKKFTALIVPSEHWNNDKSSDIGSFEFMVDGKTVHKTGVIPSNIYKPIEIEIDLEGALTFEIKGKGGDLGIVEAKFIE